MPANYAFTLEVIEYAQSLRQKNENWQKAYIRITEILGKIPGGIDKLLDSIDAEPFDEETVQRMLGKIRGEIPIKKTSKPQQEQPDDS